jgi:hypothetical protein
MDGFNQPAYSDAPTRPARRTWDGWRLYLAAIAMWGAGGGVALLCMKLAVSFPVLEAVSIAAAFAAHLATYAALSWRYPRRNKP